MSRLRELRLQGFKTFADPTRFVFEPGVNAVIGPNGSGKSNMADAVRWVLGEQSNRSLRTRRADDVIFTGSQQRKATGLAEVVLTLDNADGWLPIDFGEVTIGRRAYRSGESEYLINGARARLRDVVELLAAGQLGANSLVVVGQGTVDAALSLRPEERRQLFEEAAGVKNLQVRKNEALARLSRAQENLTRVNDLLGELRPQVRRLALQAQHQQEHDTLRQRGRALVLETYRRREREIRSALGNAHRRAAAAEAAAEAIRIETTSSREALTAAEGAYWEAEAAARRGAEERETTREAVIRAESRAEALAARRTELLAARERAEAELLRFGADTPLSDDDDGRIDAALAAARRAEQDWQDATRALEHADGELLAAEEALDEARRRDAERVAAAARRREEEAEAIARRERFERELAAAREEQSAAEAVVRQGSEDGAEGTARAQALRATLAEAERAADAAHARTADLRQRATALAERLAAIEASLEALIDVTEQRAGLGRRLADSGWRPLVDALPAPDAAWPAIEAVVGGELAEALLWRDGDPASATADARGVARLLDGRTGPSGPERAEALAAVGATRTLAEWIAATAASSPAIFSRVAVAPGLDELMAGWRSLPAGWCAVTAEGDLADGRGMIALRGRADPPGGMGARRLARRGELATEVERLRLEHETAADRAAQAVAEAGGLERRRSELRAQVADAERVERLAAEERQAAEARRERASVDIARLDEQLRALSTYVEQAVEDDASSAGHVPLEVRAQEARRKREEAAAVRDGTRAAWQAARSTADELERAGGERRRAQSERLARRAQLLATIEAAAAVDGGGERDDALAQALTAARAADDAANGRRRQAEAEREVRRARLLELERTGSSAGARLQDAERALAASTIEVSRHEEALAAAGRERSMALDALEGAAEDTEGSAPAVDEELAAEVAALGAEALAVEERRVRRTLAQIGSVNPFAVEEHREQSARLEEIAGQETDLQSAIASTRELIGTLDGEIGERFEAAFRAIGTRFDEFVRLLFAGGSASLEVGESEESESGGIEIVVRPPGKRPQRLSMLSGGERALTGVALLFAMLSVNPVPFCILDEVDAALDEANIGRFAQALRQLSAQIDFVVITHNRATIEVADTIYGVTMTDAAVSRVLSLRLADVVTDSRPADAVAEVPA